MFPVEIEENFGRASGGPVAFSELLKLFKRDLLLPKVWSGCGNWLVEMSAGDGGRAGLACWLDPWVLNWLGPWLVCWVGEKFMAAACYR